MPGTRLVLEIPFELRVTHVDVVGIGRMDELALDWVFGQRVVYGLVEVVEEPHPVSI